MGFIHTLLDRARVICKPQEYALHIILMIINQCHMFQHSAKSADTSQEAHYFSLISDYSVVL